MNISDFLREDKPTDNTETTGLSTSQPLLSVTVTLICWWLERDVLGN